MSANRPYDDELPGRGYPSRTDPDTGDHEISLGTPTILGIFFALVLVCAALSNSSSPAQPDAASASHRAAAGHRADDPKRVGRSMSCKSSHETSSAYSAAHIATRRAAGLYPRPQRAAGAPASAASAAR